MKLKGTLLTGLLCGAMLALPMTVPAFAEPAYDTNSGHVQQVDWWWDHYQNDRDAYANHGWHKGYYQYGGQRYACERARKLQNQVWNDRRTGHPDAAKDVAQEAAEARAHCYNQ